MNPSVTNSEQTENIRAKLVAAYRDLPPAPRAIVDYLAVALLPATRTSIAQALGDLGVRDTLGRALTAQRDFPPLVKDLVARQLLREDAMRLFCNPLIQEVAARRLKREGRFAEFASVARRRAPLGRSWDNRPRYRNQDEMFREARLAFYADNREDLERIVDAYNHQFGWYGKKANEWGVIKRIIENPPDGEHLLELTTQIRYSFLWGRFQQPVRPAAEAASLLRVIAETRGQMLAKIPESEEGLEAMFLLLAEQHLLRGEWDEALELFNGQEAETPDAVEILICRAWLCFLRGFHLEAAALFDGALKQLRKLLGMKKVWFTRIAGFFYILALLKTKRAEDRQLAASFVELAISKDIFADISVAFRPLFDMLDGRKPDLQALDRMPAILPDAPLHGFFHLLTRFWVEPRAAQTHLPGLVFLHRQARDAGYAWLAAEVAELLHRLGAPGSYGEEAAAFRAKYGAPSIVDTVERQEPWVRTLDALAALGQAASPEVAAEGGPATRLVWQLQLGKGFASLTAREQQRNKKGQWSSGKNIALKRLHGQQLAILSEQDRRVCVHLKAQRVGYYGQMEYFFANTALPELVGHPHVYLAEAPDTPVEVVRARPELQVERGKKGKGLAVRLSPPCPGEGTIVVEQESANRVRVVEFTEQHRRMAELLGQAGLSVPEAATERLMTVVGGLAGVVNVHSDVEAEVAGAREVTADPRPTVLLRPQGEGLRAHLCVRPLGVDGPRYVPGGGKAMVVAQVAGERLRASRDLAEEDRRAERLLASCGALTEEAEAVGEREWVLPHPETCLELLLDLEDRPADEVVVAWPEGRTMKVLPRAGLDKFRLNVRAQKDWFGIEGGLAVDADRVLELKDLLKLLDGSPGRFLPMGQGEFLALTGELRKRLDEMRAFTQSYGKGLRFRPLAAHALAGLFDGAGELKADKAWKAFDARLQAARDFVPKVPSTLQAELRDYQREGFAWLARLAKLGAGACLADDMGLGKTLQALALLIDRAPEGPALVVAPVSVCANWLDEAARFAPTLNFLAYGNGNRQEQVAGLRPLDVLVVSYGLLQTEETAAILAGVTWSTVVLDEAQAIKNFQTKRSQAAMKLDAGFRLITTGTPIENHLGELWNLFRFLNPGLLGSLEEFNDRFANPIEQRADAEARRRLRKLIQPFILRRTKGQVLEELPPRTDIVLHVDLSPAEAALYEALRQKAVEAVTDASGPPGARHLKILAEIMKLRRACCHPRLVLPESSLEGSKLQVLGEVVDELLESRHKALVFSQFVDHLAIVRDFLGKRGIRFQYLDGQTPARERKKAVDAFQAGEGELFLISLKAGGTGLNLTAADYVIHLDPWWNPAVEDQASDRAHRIGQDRPVTVYRLVARGTIEEKIVSLHGKKRDLAEGLLAGSDMTGRISTDELIRLIRGT